MHSVRFQTLALVACWTAVALTDSAFSQGIEGRRKPPKPKEVLEAEAKLESQANLPLSPPAISYAPPPVTTPLPDSLVRFTIPESSPFDLAPNIIGGFHNQPLQVFHEVKSGSDFQLVQRGNTFDVSAPSGRGVRIAENNSAVPRDRYFLHYNHFAGVYAVSAYSTGLANFRTNNFDVDRWTLGFEKTFPERNWSFEMRIPMGSTLDPSMTLDVNDRAGNMDWALGNITLVFKQVLFQSERTIVSGGFGVETPTSGQTRVTLVDFGTVFQGGTGLVVEDLIRYQRLKFENNTVNLHPFLAFLHAPNDRWFTQGFLQFHVPTDRNRVSYMERADDMQFLQPDVNSNFGPFQLDRGVRDQALAHLSLAVGQWLQNSGGRFFTAVAPTIEIHYTQTLEQAQRPILVPDPFPLLRQNPDLTSAGVTEEPVRLGNFKNYQSMLTAVVGATFVNASGGTLAFGFGLPLMSKADKVEDFQFQVQWNHRFGGSRRETFSVPMPAGAAEDLAPAAPHQDARAVPSPVASPMVSQPVPTPVPVPTDSAPEPARLTEPGGVPLLPPKTAANAESAPAPPASPERR